MWSNRGPKFFRRHVGGHFGSQCIALRGRHCIARQALHLHCHQHHVTGCGNIVELCERQSIMMPTDAYRSNFFAVKKFVFACEYFLLPFESICSWDAYAWQSMLPLQLFIFDTMTLVHARAHDRWLQVVVLWCEWASTSFDPLLSSEHLPLWDRP